MQNEALSKLIRIVLTIGIIGILAPIPLNYSLASLDPPTGTIGSTETPINYTLYSNPNIGISFEYPSDWKVDEKTSRFSDGADVEVSKGFNSFKYMQDKTDVGDSDFFDLEFMADMAQNELTKQPETQLVESVDMDKYKISGLDTATFLVKTEKSFSENSFLTLDYATQVFLVDADNRFDTIMYQDTVTKFDEPESQEILNHMLNTFKFDDSSGASEDDEENEDEQNEDN